MFAKVMVEVWLSHGMRGVEIANGNILTVQERCQFSSSFSVLGSVNFVNLK